MLALSPKLNLHKTLGHGISSPGYVLDGDTCTRAPKDRQEHPHSTACASHSPETTRMAHPENGKATAPHLPGSGGKVQSSSQTQDLLDSIYIKSSS